MFTPKKDPAKVFTPRSPQVNPIMYIDRPDLEIEVRRALNSTQHLSIAGESGTGKSWLYQRVFEINNVSVAMVNMALAARHDDLHKAFELYIGRFEPARKAGFSESASAELSTLFLKGNFDTVSYFEYRSTDPYEQLLELVRALSGKRDAVIVLDNFEQILDSDKVVKQVASTIVLLDDPAYAHYKVRLALVGVPDDFERYFSKIQQQSTVANRIQELPEVAAFSEYQSESLLRKGLCDEVGLRVRDDEMTKIVRHAIYITSCVPQQLHEYGLQLAHVGIGNYGELLASATDIADKRWLRGSLSSSFSAVKSAMNARDTAAGRRNQTLFALGQFHGRDFRYSDIEPIVRNQFPKSTVGVQLNVSQTLAQLEDMTTPIIRKTPKGDDFRFTNPKYRMVLRTALLKTEGEKVDILDPSSIL